MNTKPKTMNTKPKTMNTKTNTPPPPANPYPVGYNAFRSITIPNAFPFARWSKLDLLADYCTLAPNMMPYDAPIRKQCDSREWLKAARRYVDYMRRNDIASIIRCALSEAEECRDHEAVRALGKLNPERMVMPTIIAHEYTRSLIKRTYWHSHLVPDRVERTDIPMKKLVDVNRVILSGYNKAMGFLTRAEMDAEVKAYAKVEEDDE